MQTIKWPLELSKELTIANEEFKKTIQQFSEAQFLATPGGNAWSVAKIAEHVILSDQEIYKSVSGETIETQREPDRNINQLKTIFLDFQTKMSSPDFIIPQGKFKTKLAALESLDHVLIKLHDATNNLDLSGTCTEIVVKEFKGFTRLELLYFTVVHTQRHTHQMKQLAASVR